MKKNLRLVLSFLLIISMVVAFAGCGVKQQAAEKKEEVKWPTKDITVVVPWC